MVEVGAGAGGKHKIKEMKFLNSLKKTRKQGRGTQLHGGCAMSTGHERAFGSTEEQVRYENLGCPQRGRPSDPPFDHKTGRGFVEAHDGHYQDALVNKKNEVEIIVHETLGGGFSPSAVNAIFRYKRMARAGFDNTKYRKSTKHISYLAHHTQSISTAITREDSRAMHEALSKKMAELSRHRPGGRA